MRKPRKLPRETKPYNESPEETEERLNNASKLLQIAMPNLSVKRTHPHPQDNPEK
jgi:hypothetical protein